MSLLIWLFCGIIGTILLSFTIHVGTPLKTPIKIPVIKWGHILSVVLAVFFGPVTLTISIVGFFTVLVYDGLDPDTRIGSVLCKLVLKNKEEK